MTCSETVTITCSVYCVTSVPVAILHAFFIQVKTEIDICNRPNIVGKASRFHSNVNLRPGQQRNWLNNFFT